MRDKGGSDLDVFNGLTKGGGARGQTVVGVPAPGPDSHNGAPPPPPSLRETHYDADELSVEDDLDETDLDAPELEVGGFEDIEEVDAIGEEEFGFRADENTNVFSLPQTSVPAPSASENAYQYSEPAWSPAAPPYMPPQQLSAPPVSSASRYGAPGGPAAISASLPPTPAFPSLSPGIPTSAGFPVPPPPMSYAGRPHTSAPPPPPPPAPPQSSIGDWDDEDDKTTVYSRESGHMPTFGTLNRHIPAPSVVPGAPPPPMSRPSAPIPMQPTPSVPLPRPSPLPTDVMPPASVPPTATASKAGLYLGGGVALALLAALVFVLMPRAGTLVVTVAGPGNKPLEHVEVVVDGKVVCQASPCTLTDVASGTHLVRARATGYQATADTAVPVTGGQDAVHNVKLDPAKGTGLKVSAAGNGLRLWIDDKEIGSLPQELTDLEPGTHRLKLVGDAFHPLEQSVEVIQNEMLDIGPLKPKVAKGVARILPGENADDARIVLETGSERKSIPRLPLNLQIDTSKPHVLLAQKPGFADFRKELTFDNGEAERTFEVVLIASAESSTPIPDVAQATPAPRSMTAQPRPATAQAPAPKPAPTATGGGTLNINAIPKASVILDGRPLGITPKVGISVGSGPHTVILVKDGQRVTKSVNVKAGTTSTVVHRF
jgi:PEGA domain